MKLLLFALLCYSLTAAEKPNVIIIFIDDMGYADIGPFGAKGHETPHLDRMAKEGMKFTDFSVSSAVCSASRAALLTGCYNARVSIAGAFGPSDSVGLNPSEITIAEICKQHDYATACFGKWHLGHHPKFLPTNQGFDEYYGLPYSNDMWPYHPETKVFPALPLVEGTKVINPTVTPEDQVPLTTEYTKRSVDFIKRNKDKPFFLYLAHAMVHVPLFVSEKYKGKSGSGLYGDVVMEVDWSVGQILDTLRALDLDQNTLVIFTSDNGPWLSYGNHAGSAAPLREGKGTMWEGGCRVPTLMRWPGKIPAGSVCDEFASTIDILPTIAAINGAKIPDHKIDGKDIRPLMFGEKDAKSPHEFFYHYYANELQCVRDRQWKLIFPHTYRTLAGKPGGTDGIPTKYTNAKSGLELYDLKNDVSESTNLASKHPEIVERLTQAAQNARNDLGDKLTNTRGQGVRPVGKLNADDHKLK
jgi:arylsulfatase A-like enzyme